jgi:hypothetical protein
MEKWMRFLWSVNLGITCGRTCEGPPRWPYSRGVDAPCSGTRAICRACRGNRSGRGPFRARRALRT